MMGELKELHKKLVKLRDGLATDAPCSGEPPSRRISSLANSTAILLLNDVLEWRVVFLDRPLEVG